MGTKIEGSYNIPGKRYKSVKEYSLTGNGGKEGGS
jgi:hypothetical protein